MNPNHEPDLALSSPLAEAVRTIAEAPLDERAIERVRLRAGELAQTAQRPPARPSGYSRKRLAVLTGAGLAASVLIAVVLVLVTGRDAWAQVAESLRSKAWVRLTMQIPDGAEGVEEIPDDVRQHPPQIWLSLQKQAAASNFLQAAHYCDFTRQELYRYEPNEKTIYFESTSDNDHVFFEHFNTLLRLVAAGDRQLKLPDSPIEIIERREIEVRDGTRRLTEFAFKLRDARRTPTEYAATVRVDVESRLPLSMSCTERLPNSDKTVTRSFVFDYPDSGPADIYALGVPRTATVVDWRRPSGAKEIFAAYSKAQSRQSEPYSAVVLVAQAPGTFKDVFEAYRVRCDGQKWQLAQAELQPLLDFRMSVWNKQVVLPPEVDPAAWWKEQVEKLPFAPLTDLEYPRNHQAVPDCIGYMPVGDPSAPGGQITIDQHPLKGPPETIRFGVRTTAGINDFWMSPQHDYMIQRFECISPGASEWKIYTTVIDKVAKSPGGRWYATQARCGNVQNSGDDLPDQIGVAPIATSVYRYFVEFDQPQKAEATPGTP